MVGSAHGREQPWFSGDLLEGSTEYGDQGWRGMVVDIWLQLAATLNFTFTLGLSSDRKWGAKNQVEFVYSLLFFFCVFLLQL